MRGSGGGSGGCFIIIYRNPIIIFPPMMLCYRTDVCFLCVFQENYILGISEL